MTHKQVERYQCTDGDPGKIKIFTEKSLQQNTANLSMSENNPDTTQNY